MLEVHRCPVCFAQGRPCQPFILSLVSKVLEYGVLSPPSVQLWVFHMRCCHCVESLMHYDAFSYFPLPCHDSDELVPDDLTTFLLTVVFSLALENRRLNQSGSKSHSIWHSGKMGGVSQSSE